MAPTWTPCTEQLPDSDETVLTYDPTPGANEPVWPGYHDGEQWWDILGCAIPERRVTHWMPFPDPPGEAGTTAPADPEDTLP